MKLIPICIALSVTLLPSFVYARLDPQELSHLTMVTNYTFHSICNDFDNPDLYFDEAGLYTYVLDFTRDLYTYFSTRNDDAETSYDRLSQSQRVERRPPRFDCIDFEYDVRSFSESFKNMTYAISEKCYRQCQPKGYVWNSATQLQRAYEQGYQGSFYTQIREIQAETGCRFSDYFLIENERATDYTKVWIETFQSHKRPCAGLGR